MTTDPIVRVAFAVLAAWLVAQPVAAQRLSGVDHLRFEHLSVEQGLSQSIVRAALQDRRGFIWVATQDGLNQYDGYRVVRFAHEPDRRNSLPSSYVTALAETETTAGPLLWAGTSAGLSAFDAVRQRFTTYRHTAENTSSLSSDDITALHTDAKGRLWVGTSNGLNRLDAQSGTFDRLLQAAPGATPQARHHIAAIASEASGIVWVGTRDGLFRLEPTSGATTRFAHDPDVATSLAHNEIRTIHVDRRNRVWVGLQARGLDRLDPANGRFQHYQRTESPTSLAGETVTAVLEDQAGGLWVGLWGGGIARLVNGDGGEPRFVPYRHDATDASSLASDDVTALLQDRSGAIWAATYGGGISRFDPDAARRFTHYRHVPADPRSLSDNRVYALLVDRAGDVWVGTWGGGLNRMRAGSDGFERYAVGRGPFQLNGTRVTSLAEGPDGHVWVGLLDGGVNRINPRTGEVTRFAHDAADAGSLTSDEVTAVLVDRKGTVWVGTSRDGLNRYEPPLGRFTHISPDAANDTTLSDGGIQALYEDLGGRLWVGTRRGLNIVEPRTGTAIRVAEATGAPAAMGGAIESIAETSDGAIWVGSQEGGVTRIELSGGGRPLRFRTYRQQHGLPNDRVYRAIPDAADRVWITTDRGLARLDPADDTIVRFDVEDGLQAEEFRSSGFFDRRTGRLFVGGVNGFNVFVPAEIAPATFRPPVVLTAFSILNQPVPIGGESRLKTRITDAREVTLGPDDAVFSLEFAALDYIAPQRVRYAYMLEGFDRDWNKTDATRRFATYTNLSPGRYVFKVRASNHDEVWASEPIQLTVTVLPPWWMTWWFRLLAVAGSVGVVVRVVRRRFHGLERQRRELEGLVAQRTRELHAEKERADAARASAEQANAAKSMFLANVSHEIRTPLNAVVGLSEALSDLPLDRRQREYAGALRAASEALSGLITNILDLSKIEAGRLDLATERFDLRSVVADALQLVQVNAEKKGLALTQEVDPQVPRLVNGDPQALRRVLFNLLANAVKFTAAGGVSVHVDAAGGDALRFRVTDTGIGIGRDEQQHIFDDFTQADASISRVYGGTGLGLAISRRFVQLMGGTIWVDSTPGEGSTFGFTAPLPAAGGDVVPAAGLAALAGPEPLALRILMVDDAVANRTVMQALLQGIVQQLDAVDNGPAAIDVVKQRQHDVVLMDVDMPGMDGLEATRRIRRWEKQRGLPRLPILAMTAHAFEEDIERSRNAGCDSHLTKPLRRQTLVDALRPYVGSTPDPKPQPPTPTSQFGGNEGDPGSPANPSHVSHTSNPGDAGAAPPPLRVAVPHEIAILVPEYLASMRVQLTKALSALDAGDCEPLRRVAHNLKGSGGSYGLDHVSALGARLEEQAVRRATAEARDVARMLDEYLARIEVVAEGTLQ